MQNRINTYASLSELRQYWSFEGTEASDLNPKMRDYLSRSSRAIDRYTRQRFFPLKKTKWFDYPESDYIRFGEFFLELLGLSGQSGDDGMPVDIFWKRCGANWNITPYDTIEVNDTTGSSISYSGTKRRAVKTIALYGYREDYDDPQTAWIATGASIVGTLTSAASAIPTSASTVTNELGYSPGVQADQLWRLGSGASQEFIWVTDTGLGGSSGSQVAIRGINGTTAASHADGTGIFAFDPEPEIKLQTMRVALWMYEVKDNPTTQRHFFPQMGGFELADGWPRDVKDALKRYRDLSIKSF